MDTVQFCCHSNKINCIGCGCYYELLVVLAINEATTAMETVDGLVCCDLLGWWFVTANGDGGITEFECPAIWLAASRPELPVLVLWLVIAANDVALVAMVSASPAPAPAAAMPTMSSMLVCAIIFWRTSLILSCKQTLVGNTSWYFAWKADVAWAIKKQKFKDFKIWTKGFFVACIRRLREGNVFQSCPCQFGWPQRGLSYGDPLPSCLFKLVHLFTWGPHHILISKRAVGLRLIRSSCFEDVST